VHPARARQATTIERGEHASGEARTPSQSGIPDTKLNSKLKPTDLIVMFIFYEIICTDWLPMSRL